jgi:cytochrome b subunit of formate dehydrogenase
MSKNKSLLYLDAGIFVFFVLISLPKFTGITIHEWASFIFIPVIILHILMKWDWVVTITRQTFKRMPGETRFDQAWDYLLFMVMTTVIISGIIISEKALPVFGIPINNDPFWLTVHHLSTALLLLIVGIHIGMHWRWVVNAINRYVFRRNRPTKPVIAPERN